MHEQRGYYVYDADEQKVTGGVEVTPDGEVLREPCPSEFAQKEIGLKNLQVLNAANWDGRPQFISNASVKAHRYVNQGKPTSKQKEQERKHECFHPKINHITGWQESDHHGAGRLINAHVKGGKWVFGVQKCWPMSWTQQMYFVRRLDTYWVIIFALANSTD